MLQKAIESKDLVLAEELLVKGEALPSDIPDYRMTHIFDIVVREKAFAIINLLMEKGVIELDIYEYDSFNKSIFASIIKHLSGDHESVDFLNTFIPKILSLNDELEGKSLLSFALENEAHPEIIKVLVGNGCDVHIISRSEENLIHQVVKKYVRSYDNGLQYLRYLCDEGVAIDKPNIVGQTPLHLAVKEHRTEYIEWLLKNGADPNIPNKEGESPFFMAIANSADMNKYKIMREFALPDFDQENIRGETILYESIRMGCSAPLLKLLLEDGADLYHTSTYYGHQVTAIDILAEKPSELLQVALDSGQLDVNRKDDMGNTLLHKICGRETLHEERRAKEVYRNVKLLLSAGVDANVRNDSEETPMMIASNDDLKTKTVELLLSQK